MSKIGSLWRNEKKESKVVASGTLEVIAGLPIKIVIFENDKKEEGTNQPDLNICISTSKEEKQEDKKKL